MKNSLLIISLTAFLSACQPNNSSNQEAEIDQQAELRKLNDFKIKLTEINLNKLEAINEGLVLFKKSFKSQPAEINDRALIEFKKFHYNVTSSIYPDFVAVETMNPFYDLKKINEKLSRYGIVAYEAGGTLFLKNSRKFYVKNFYEFLTPPCLNYEKKAADEDNELIVDDGTITVKLTQLIDRIAWREEVLSTEKVFILKDEILEEIKILKVLLAEGSENTPAFGYSFEEQPRQLNQDFKEAYLYCVDKYKHLPIGDFFNRYLTVLKENGFIYNPAVENFLRAQLR